MTVEPPRPPSDQPTPAERLAIALGTADPVDPADPVEPTTDSPATS